VAGCSVVATTLIDKELRQANRAACQPATVSQAGVPAQARGLVCLQGDLSIPSRRFDDVGVFTLSQEAVYARPSEKFFAAFRLTRCKLWRSIRDRAIVTAIPRGEVRRMATTAEWLHKIAHLRVYKAKGGPAPHKPLLLLVLLELAEEGILPEDVLPLTPELAFRFCTSWNIVAPRRTQRPDVRLPFHHLQSDGFWSALGEDGKPSPDDRLTRSAALVSDFVGFANDPAHRDKARRILIAKYFPPDEQGRLNPWLRPVFMNLRSKRASTAHFATVLPV